MKDGYGFIGGETPCPFCNQSIPNTVPGGKCPKCGKFLMGPLGFEILEYDLPLPKYTTLEDYLNEKYPEPELVSKVNFHTFLFAMFNCSVENKELFTDAIKRMDELSYEKTFEKVGHLAPLDPTPENLVVAAKLILDHENT